MWKGLTEIAVLASAVAESRSIPFRDVSQLLRTPLQEDRVVRGYLPVQAALAGLDFGASPLSEEVRGLSLACYSNKKFPSLFWAMWTCDDSWAEWDGTVM